MKHFSTKSVNRFFCDFANSGFDRPRVFVKNQTIDGLFPLYVVDAPELIDYTKKIIETKFESDSSLLNKNKEGDYYITKLTFDRINNVILEMLLDEDDKNLAKKVLAQFNDLKEVISHTTQNFTALQSIFHDEVQRAVNRLQNGESVKGFNSFLK